VKGADGRFRRIGGHLRQAWRLAHTTAKTDEIRRADGHRRSLWARFNGVWAGGRSLERHTAPGGRRMAGASKRAARRPRAPSSTLPARLTPVPPLLPHHTVPMRWRILSACLPQTLLTTSPLHTAFCRAHYAAAFRLSSIAALRQAGLKERYPSLPLAPPWRARGVA